MVITEKRFEGNKGKVVYEIVDDEDYFKSVTDIYNWLIDYKYSRIPIWYQYINDDSECEDDKKSDCYFNLNDNRKIKLFIREIEDCINKIKHPYFLNKKIPNIDYIIKTLDTCESYKINKYTNEINELRQIQRECNRKSWKCFADNWDNIKDFLINYKRNKENEKNQKRKEYKANYYQQQKQKQIKPELTNNEKLEKYKQTIELRKEKQKIANKKYYEKIKNMKNELAKLDDDNSI